MREEEEKKLNNELSKLNDDYQKGSNLIEELKKKIGRFRRTIKVKNKRI